MDVNGVGWIAAIIIGGLAGWLAEMFMKSNTGLFMNIILGRAQRNPDGAEHWRLRRRLDSLSDHRLHRRLPADLCRAAGAPLNRCQLAAEGCGRSPAFGWLRT